MAFTRATAPPAGQQPQRNRADPLSLQIQFIQSFAALSAARRTDMFLTSLWVSVTQSFQRVCRGKLTSFFSEGWCSSNQTQVHTNLHLTNTIFYKLSKTIIYIL